ncbi:MAG: ABC transporter ATP-binding protein/permease [Saccharospirillaceae bacterium]|nr:ABC transporter ATP-binding protein/permease [Pseudomonadales bacterium]NRB78887.1 ABC transporter ATP-binding protein/permease [Saccharospirillaceae bacterium]
MRPSKSTEPVKPVNAIMIKHVFIMLWPYVWQFKWRVVFALITLFIAAKINVTIPFVLGGIVDHFEQPNIVVLPIAALILYGLFRFSLTFLAEVRDVVFARVTERLITKTSLNLFAHLHQMDLSFHLSRQTGGISKDMERGSQGISFIMRALLLNIAPTLLTLILTMEVVTRLYSAWFGLIILISIICYVLFTIIVTSWRTKFIRQTNVEDSKANTRAVDSLLNYETVKYFSNEQAEESRFGASLTKWEKARLKNRMSLAFLNSGQGLVITLSWVATLSLSCYEVLQGNMSQGDLVAVNALMMTLFGPLNMLGFIYREIKRAMTDLEHMYELLNTKSLIVDAENASNMQCDQAKIEFKNVDFHYDKKRQILNKINFTILPGQKVALVGASGSGKSTLAKLLFRFYDTTKGQIFIDSQDISTVSQYSLRKNIGVVPQDTVLFNDTIFENIRYGRLDANDDDIWKAIEEASLFDFIQSLPEKENTMVGERGLKLSGGEKQRVSIARVFLKNPKILIFDEATSSLDTLSEQKIMASFNALSEEKSTLVIAHRLSTIVDADKIVVLDAGQVIEQGTHDELIAKDSKYAILWDQQRSEQNKLD